MDEVGEKTVTITVWDKSGHSEQMDLPLPLISPMTRDYVRQGQTFCLEVEAVFGTDVPPKGSTT